MCSAAACSDSTGDFTSAACCGRQHSCLLAACLQCRDAGQLWQRQALCWSLAADPDCADKYFDHIGSLKVFVGTIMIGNQGLTVSQELCVFCMLPALQCVTTNCMLATTAV